MKPIYIFGRMRILELEEELERKQRECDSLKKQLDDALRKISLLQPVRDRKGRFRKKNEFDIAVDRFGVALDGFSKACEGYFDSLKRLEQLTTMI